MALIGSVVRASAHGLRVAGLISNQGYVPGLEVRMSVVSLSLPLSLKYPWVKINSKIGGRPSVPCSRGRRAVLEPPSVHVGRRTRLEGLPSPTAEHPERHLLYQARHRTPRRGRRCLYGRSLGQTWGAVAGTCCPLSDLVPIAFLVKSVCSWLW